MTGATHRLGGAAIGLVTAELFIHNNTPTLQVAIVTGAILGSLLPDIDNPKSSISYKWRLISSIISFFQFIIRSIASLLPRKSEKYIRSVVGHRGFSHSLTICIILSALIMTLAYFYNIPIILQYFMIGIPVGMISHIVLDMFAGGVPLFSPISVKRITLANIKTGGAVEWIVRMIAISSFVLIVTRIYFI